MAIIVAVFKFHLYEIDVIISRSITFGVLAAFIGALYVGIVVGLGSRTPLVPIKVLIFNDDGPIYDRNGTLFRQLNLAQCEQFLAESSEHAPANSPCFSLEPKLPACKRGGESIISSTEDGTLYRNLHPRRFRHHGLQRQLYEVIRPVPAGCSRYSRRHQPA